MPILPWQRAWHINVWRMVGETCLHSDFFSSLCVSGTMLKQSQGSRQVSRERAKCFLSILRHTNAEQGYHKCGQLAHLNCTSVQRGTLSFLAVACRTFPL